MSDNTMILGAPSLRGEDARETLSARLAGLKFPLKVAVTNRLPFHLSFPQAGGLYLRASAHKNSSGTAEFSDADALARFVTDVQAIADLNKAEVAVEIDLPAAPRAKPKPAAAAKPE